MFVSVYKNEGGERKEKKKGKKKAMLCMHGACIISRYVWLL